MSDMALKTAIQSFARMPRTRLLQAVCILLTSSYLRAANAAPNDKWTSLAKDTAAGCISGQKPYCFGNIYVPPSDAERRCVNDDDCGPVMTTCWSRCQLQPEAISETSRRDYAIRKEERCYKQHIRDDVFEDPDTGVILRTPCAPGRRGPPHNAYRAVCVNSLCEIKGLDYDIPNNVQQGK